MMLRRLPLLFAIALTLGLPLEVRAEWYEASSDHFVIYADDSEKDIRQFAENLEKYHQALEFLTKRNVAKPSPSNRVTIFVVGSDRAIKRLAGSDDIGGFYIPRAGASKAFVQDIRNKSGYPHFSTVILLHEYAHHFLISSSRFAMPRWLNEGAAEFFAATSFNRDGSVLIGRPAQHRAFEVFNNRSVSARDLLDTEYLRERRDDSDDGFYGRSWLLYHYLTFSEDRRGQMTEYRRKVMDGRSSLDAAQAVFGDLDQLESELEAYRKARKMFTFDLPADTFSVGEISLRKLPEGEAEMMDVRMVSQRGVSSAQAANLVVEAREIAAKYPDDAGVLAALAEAEFDAGNDDAVIAAADKAIAIEPLRTNPYVQKGFALFRKAGNANGEKRATAYKAAMKPFVALNRLENDHPLPLIFLFRSFAERGAEPDDNARKALERAAQLAPFDQFLWLQVAVMQAQEGKIELARASLQPLAANPHGGGNVDLAQQFLVALDRAEEGLPVTLGPGAVDLPQLSGAGTTSHGEDETIDEAGPAAPGGP